MDRYAPAKQMEELYHDVHLIFGEIDDNIRSLFRAAQASLRCKNATRHELRELKSSIKKAAAL